MKTIFAVAAAALLAAAPAFAAEEYQAGPARPITAQVPAFDTGSAQTPHFDGQAALAGDPVLAGNASEASVESVNSQTVALGTVTAPASRLAQR